MNPFYNKEIEVYLNKKIKDKNGITRYVYLKVDGIRLVDVQPYSKDKAKRDYGYDIETTKRIFCEIDKDILESSLVNYRGNFYSIQTIIEWDDYLEIMLLEKVVDSNEFV